MADPKSWNPEIVRTKMFGKPLEMTRKGWYKTAVSTSRLPSGYTLRVNMTSDTFLEEADGWRTERRIDASTAKPT